MLSIKGNQMFDNRIVPLGMTAVFIFCNSAFADTATNTLDVNLTVVQTCTVAAATLTFASNSFGTPIDTPSGTVTVTCNAGSVAPTITIGVGSHAEAAVVPRRLKFSGTPDYFIPYELTSAGVKIVTDTALTLISAGTSTYTADLFATVTVPTTAPKGAYTDSVVMTVTYTQ